MTGFTRTWGETSVCVRECVVNIYSTEVDPESTNSINETTLCI